MGGAALTCALLLCLPFDPAAHAASDTDAPQALEVAETTEVPMSLVGFDREQAAKVGNTVSTEGSYEVLRDGAGRELGRVSAGAAESELSAETAVITPFNAVYGNCGSAFFYLYDLAGAKFAMKTGFTTNTSAYDFAWSTQTIGQNNGQTDSWTWRDIGPMVPKTSWTSGYVQSTQDTAAGTYYYGRVTKGVAMLINGGICVSGYPSAGLTLWK